MSAFVNNCQSTVFQLLVNFESMNFFPKFLKYFALDLSGLKNLLLFGVTFLLITRLVIVCAYSGKSKGLTFDFLDVTKLVQVHVA